MKRGLSAVAAITLLAAGAQGEVLVSINAATQVNGTGFSTHYGGGIGTGNNVVFSESPAITNAQVAGGTTYSAPDVYVAASKNEFTGNFGVSNDGGSGWRIRLNNSVTDGGLFFSDNLFAVNHVSFDEDNDTLDAKEIFISDMAAVSNATIRFVVRDNGNFYISQSSTNLQSGALDGNLNSAYAIEALSSSWFDYDPTISPSTNGVADIGALAAPTFDDIDFIGFHLEVETAANGTIGAHNGCNVGVREFTAEGVDLSMVDPWNKLEYWDFENDTTGTAFGSNWINSGSLNSEWNFGGPGTIAADGSGSLVISNHSGQTFRKLPKAGTTNAAAGSDAYAVPFSTGSYRLEMDFSSWSFPDGVDSGFLEFQAVSGGSAVALIRLRVNTAGNATWIQLMGREAGTQIYNTYGQGTGSTNKSVATSAAIEFDFDNDTIEYFLDGVSMKSTNTFTEVGFDNITFVTDSDWSTNNLVFIDSMGISKYVDPAVTNTPASLWNEWIAAYPDVGSNTNLLDQGDEDMLDNLTEYAWGGDPSDGSILGNVPSQSLIEYDGVDFIEYLYYERSDAASRGLASMLEVGTDLVNTNWADGSSYEVGRGESGISGFDAVTNRIPTDVETKQFIRVQVEFTP